MPYVDNPICSVPADENAKTWRYMDFPRFVAMLDRSALFFARADKMADKYEGMPTTPTIEAERKLRNNLAIYAFTFRFMENFITKYPDSDQVPVFDQIKAFMKAYDDIPDINIIVIVEHILHIAHQYNITKKVQTYVSIADVINEDNMKALRQDMTAMRAKVLLNCWYVNDYESEGMWTLYSHRRAGIAIQSTFRRMKQGFATYFPRNINISLVKYINYGEQTVPNDNPIRRYLHKRQSYEHEKELRAIILIGEDESVLNDGGLDVNFDEEALIEKIYVAPDARPWFTDLVRAITKKYDLGCEIVQSDLAKDPLT